jgi:hypothetical protein
VKTVRSSDALRPIKALEWFLTLTGYARFDPRALHKCQPAQFLTEASNPVPTVGGTHVIAFLVPEFTAGQIAGIINNSNLTGHFKQHVRLAALRSGPLDHHLGLAYHNIYMVAPLLQMHMARGVSRYKIWPISRGGNHA